jgi:hypothetical protein
MTIFTYIQYSFKTILPISSLSRSMFEVSIGTEMISLGSLLSENTTDFLLECSYTSLGWLKILSCKTAGQRPELFIYFICLYELSIYCVAITFDYLAVIDKPLDLFVCKGKAIRRAFFFMGCFQRRGIVLINFIVHDIIPF